MSYRADKQVIDTHTHWQDTQTGAMTIPEGQNWSRVKTVSSNRILDFLKDIGLYNSL